MRRLHVWVVTSVILGALAGTLAWADEEKEEKVPLDKVPRAVLDAVKARFEGAELVSAEKEKEDGKLVYEINLKHKGQKIEVTLTPEGKIVSIEKTIAAKDLPRAVREAIDKKYPGAVIEVAEEVAEKGTRYYEVHLRTADKKRVEVVLDPAGKIVKEEKKEEPKEKKD